MNVLLFGGPRDGQEVFWRGREMRIPYLEGVHEDWVDTDLLAIWDPKLGEMRGPYLETRTHIYRLLAVGGRPVAAYAGYEDFIDEPWREHVRQRRS